MKDLIQALTIFSKYTDTHHPTRCEHDIMYISEVGEVSESDSEELVDLGFEYDEHEEAWYSFRYGSC